MTTAWASINVDGSSRVIPTGASSLLDATFSPDGTRVAALTGDGLTVFSLDEGIEVASTSEHAGMPQVVWSSDSRYALFPGVHGVFVLDTSDSTVRQMMPADVFTGLATFNLNAP